MTVTLINGILCLVAAVLLLIQIRKINNQENSQYLQKFLWIYWAVLMITAIHHIFSSLFLDSWITIIISNLGPLTDTGYAIAGIVLSVYLSKRSKIKAVI